MIDLPERRPLWRDALLAAIPGVLSVVLSEVVTYVRGRWYVRRGHGVCAKCEARVEIEECSDCAVKTTPRTAETASRITPKSFSAEGVEFPEDD